MIINSTISLTPTASEQGLRVDKFIAERLKYLSRTRIKTLITSGYLTIDNCIIEDCNTSVKLGSTYILTIPPPVETYIKPNESLKINIIYEDKFLLVINKQAGLTVHPGAGNHQDTLVNALLAYYGDSLSAIGGRLRPGIVHRLDKDTSGLMVVAKDDPTHHSLTKQLASRTLTRIYLAVVFGVPKPLQGTITGNIGRHNQDRKKMSILKTGGKEAITNYSVQQIFYNNIASLIECKLVTGRTHQIRVHFSHYGHSLIGDQTYGNNKRKLSKLFSEEIQEKIYNFNRQALHAISIGFIHPITKEHMQFTTELPDDLQNLVQILSDAK
ncbi:Ribosomal large subunit pseudouridine synthase D [Rickettsiales bacterium Ac37b]|nr:Ribosomal large subunit pseudouridine synthase D [Rickettsiales bacterium Ac37b]